MFTFHDHNNSPYPPFFSVDLLFCVVFLKALFVFFSFNHCTISPLNYSSALLFLLHSCDSNSTTSKCRRSWQGITTSSFSLTFCFFSITCFYYCISFTFIQLARVHIHTIYNGKTFMILFYVLPVHYCLNCIGGVMFSVARLECGRSWVRAPVGSNHRL